MLIDDAYRYIELRRSLGFKLCNTADHLASFAEYAASVGDVHVRSDTALAWAAAKSSTHRSRCTCWGGAPSGQSGGTWPGACCTPITSDAFAGGASALRRRAVRERATSCWSSGT